MRRVGLLLVVVSWFAMAAAHAATRTWDGGAGTDNWNTAANWTDDVRPATGDDVVIPDGADGVRFFSDGTYPTGFLSVASLITGRQLTVQSGELQVNGALSVGSGGSPRDLVIEGGTLSSSGSGTVTIAGTGRLTWRGGAIRNVSVDTGPATLNNTSKTLDGAVLNIAGNAIWTAGVLFFTNAGTINVAATGTFDLAGDSLSMSSQIGGGTLNNAGSVRKTSGNASTIGIVVHNNADATKGIDVQVASLLLSGGGTSAGPIKGAGLVDFQPPFNAAFAVSGPVSVPNATFSGSGTTSISGTYDVSTSTGCSTGTVNLTGTIASLGALTINGCAAFNVDGSGGSATTPSIALSSGHLGGGNDLATATLNWTGGTMGGGAATAVTATATLGGSTKSLDGRALNLGTTTNHTAGVFFLLNGATITNPSTGTYDMKGDLTVAATSGGGTFVNLGLFKKSGGSGEGSVTVPFQNAGDATKGIDVASGTLTLSGGGTSTAPIKGLGTLDFQPPFNATFAASGAVTVARTTFSGGGTTNLSGIYNVGTSTACSAGAVNLTGAIQSVGALTISGCAPFNVDGSGGSVTAPSFALSSGRLAGGNDLATSTLNWTGGTMEGGGSTTVTGAATFAGSTKNLDGRALTLGTTTNHTAGVLFAFGGATLTNPSAGTYDLKGDVTITTSTGGGTFVNLGLLKKSAGSGSASISVPLNNAGDATKGIDVASGTLTLSGGGTSPAPIAGLGKVDFQPPFGGVFDVSGAVTITTATFSGGGSTNLMGVYNVGSTSVSAGVVILTGTASSVGPLTITSGSLAFSTGGPVSVPSLALSAGTLRGTDVVTVASLNWTGGTMQDAGETRVTGTATLAGSTKSIDGRTMTLGPTSNFTAGSLFFQNAGVLSNPAAGVLEIKGDLGASASAGGGTISNAGVVKKSTSTGTASLNVPVTNTGTVQSQAGTLSFGAGFLQTAGVLEMVGGDLQAGTFGAPMTIQGGLLRGTGTITGQLVVAGTGTLAPGTSPGVIRLAGTYAQSGGTFAVELGGKEAGQFDKLQMTGSGSPHAALGGTLAASLVDGFAPALGDIFQVATYTSRSGTFALSGVALGGGKFLKATYSDTAATLTVISENCFDTIDNDGDSQVDCVDPDCTGVPECSAIPTTTTTSTTSTTTSTTSTSTTTSVTSSTVTTTSTSTTTTTLPLVEECDNCIDDDGNGLIDWEDPACCAAQNTLQVRKIKFLRARSGGAVNGKLRLTGRLDAVEFGAANPTTEPVAILVRKTTVPTAICLDVGADKWKKKGKGFLFKDPLAKLVRGSLKPKKQSGAITFVTVGKNIDVSIFDEPNVVATVRIGGRCATGNVSLRVTRKGLVFP